MAISTAAAGWSAIADATTGGVTTGDWAAAAVPSAIDNKTAAVARRRRRHIDRAGGVVGKAMDIAINKKRAGQTGDANARTDGCNRIDPIWRRLPNNPPRPVDWQIRHDRPAARRRRAPRGTSGAAAADPPPIGELRCRYHQSRTIRLGNTLPKWSAPASPIRPTGGHTVMFSRRSTSAADMAARSEAAAGGRSWLRSTLTSRWTSGLFWLCVIIGPAAILARMGDPITAGAWALLSSMAWLGSRVGLLRTVIWMAMLPICTAAAGFGGPLLEPHLTFLPENLDPATPIIAATTIGLITLAAVVFLLSRPAHRFVADRPRLAWCNAVTGGGLMVVKLAAVIIGLTAAIQWADRNRGQLTGNPVAAKFAANLNVDLDQTVVNLSDRIDNSRLGWAVERYVPAERLVARLHLDSIDLDSFSQSLPEDLLKNLPSGLGNNAAIGGLQTGDRPIDLRSIEQLLRAQ